MSSVIGEVGVYAPALHRLRSPSVFQINTTVGPPVTGRPKPTARTTLYNLC